MKKIVPIFITIVLAMVCGNAIAQDVPAASRVQQVDAFPGAEGHGRYTNGGRGGKVYHVTTLEDTEHKGSLRWACKQKGARTIVFDVAGTIELTKPLKINEDSITIAGQTAPGDGICLKNYGFVIQASNVIVRYLRSRLGFDKEDQEDDAFSVMGKGNNELHDIIIDHCSASWSIDECFSAYGVRNMTVQWCFITESLFASGHSKGIHGYGGLWGGAPATFHHNLIAHHTSRTPRLSGSRFTGDAAAELVDIRNNVFYNWGTINGGYGGDGGHFNFVNNYYKPGPRTIRKPEIDTKTGKEKPAKEVVWRIFSPNGDPGEYVQEKGVWGKFFLEGNYMDVSVEGMTPEQQINCLKVNANNQEGLIPNEKLCPLPAGGKEELTSNEPFDCGKIATQPAEVAYALVLNYGGCSLSRDTIDRRVAMEVANGDWHCKGSSYKKNIAKNSKGEKMLDLMSTYGIIDNAQDAGGWPELKATPEEIAFATDDSNGNGIPDGWEKAYFGNLVDGNGHDKNRRYTNLELYLAWRVQEITNAQRGQ